MFKSRSGRWNLRRLTLLRTHVCSNAGVTILSPPRYMMLLARNNAAGAAYRRYEAMVPQVDERSTGRRTRERALWAPPSEGDLPTRQTATLATVSLRTSELHGDVGVSARDSENGIQGIGLTDPSEMAVGDNLTPECRSAYVRRALAVSIVTYRGSKPRSIVAGAPWRDSRQFDGRSSAFRKVVDLQRKPTKDALWAASVLQSTLYAVTLGLAACKMSMPVCDRAMSTSEQRASIFVACRNSSTGRAGPCPSTDA